MFRKKSLALLVGIMSLLFYGVTIHIWHNRFLIVPWTLAFFIICSFAYWKPDRLFRYITAPIFLFIAFFLIGSSTLESLYSPWSEERIICSAVESFVVSILVYPVFVVIDVLSLCSTNKC